MTLEAERGLWDQRIVKEFFLLAPMEEEAA